MPCNKPPLANRSLGEFETRCCWTLTGFARRRNSAVRGFEDPDCPSCAGETLNQIARTRVDVVLGLQCTMIEKLVVKSPIQRATPFESRSRSSLAAIISASSYPSQPLSPVDDFLMISASLDVASSFSFCIVESVGRGKSSSAESRVDTVELLVLGRVFCSSLVVCQMSFVPPRRH